MWKMDVFRYYGLMWGFRSDLIICMVIGVEIFQYEIVVGYFFDRFKCMFVELWGMELKFLDEFKIGMLWCVVVEMFYIRKKICFFYNVIGNNF